MSQITCSNDGGLCNRIKCLLSAWHVYNTNVKIYWPINNGCSVKPDELWSNDLEAKAKGTTDLNTWRLLLNKEDVVPEQESGQFSSVREFYGSDTNYKDIDFEYNRIPKEIQLKYLALLSKLKTHQYILDHVNSVDIDANCVAVHIRSWHDDQFRHDRYFDLNKYTTEMDILVKANPKTKFVMASDDIKYINELKSKYPIITLPLIGSFKKDRVEALAPFMQLLLLSRCHTLIATHISTFSEMIWWYSKCTMNVIVVAKNIDNMFFNKIKPNLVNKQTLVQLGMKYGTDKVSHGFCKYYDKILSNIRGSATQIMEIGVFFGASIRMWKEYFNKAVIHGVDHFTGKQGNGTSFNDPMKYYNEIKNNPDPRIILHNVNQSDSKAMTILASKFSNASFDVILDDGSHIMYDQQISLAILFKLLKPGGIFIIEDIHCSNEYPGYGLLPDLSNSTLKMIENYQKTNNWTSRYLSKEELDYLNLYTKSAEIFIKDSNSMSCAIYKK